MTLRIATVADSISKLSVSGLTICDIDQIKAQADKRGSWLFPLGGFLSSPVHTRDSFGGSSAKMTLSYTFNYRLLYKPVGTGRTMTLEQIAGLVAMVGLIWDAILAIDTITGCEDITIESLDSADGSVEDPSGNLWWGYDMGFRITEFVN